MSISVKISYTFGEKTMVNQNDTLNNNFENIKGTGFGLSMKNGLGKIVVQVSAATILVGSLITPPSVFPAKASEANICPSESVSRSISGKVSTKMVFKNNSSNAVKTYWLNYSGERVFYKKLNPNQSYTQQTYVTHPWVITDDSDNCLGVYYPDGQTQTVEIQ